MQLTEKPIYFDADDLITGTADLLQGFGRKLRLSHDLTERYETFAHTGNACGDTSEEIRSGSIDRSKSDYTDIVVPDHLTEQCQAAYAHCRVRLRERASSVSDRGGRVFKALLNGPEGRGRAISRNPSRTGP